MSKEVRMKLSEAEQVAASEGLNLQAFQGDSIEELVKKENTRKFNDKVEKYEQLIKESNQQVEDSKDKLEYDINKAEILPMFNRILIIPYEANPFQKIEMENGIITDTGGYDPHYQLNPNTGRYEKQEEVIKVGCVVEVGSECKYLKEGDTVYYNKHTAVPVPFFKQNLYTLGEQQILAVVNENLKERFNGK